jgi:uncharacterized protein YdhG (YjbR/CyaY superfamily)
MAAPRDIDDYLSGVADPAQRGALQHLRALIHEIAPDAVECISYQMPTFRQDGMVVSFAAWKKHCALYPLSVKTTRTFATELEGFDQSKGTIRFTPDRPLPDALVRKLVEARLAENASRRLGKSKK